MSHFIILLLFFQFPRASSLPEEWENNKESMIKYMEATHWGARGQVLDGDSSEPLYQAVVEVEGIDHNLTTTERGEFWRPLAPSEKEYRLRFHAYGYQTSDWMPVKAASDGKPAEMMTIKLKKRAAASEEGAAAVSGADEPDVKSSAVTLGPGKKKM